MSAALITRRASGIFDAVGPLNPDRDLHEALPRFAVEVLALMMRPDVRDLHRLVVAESQDFTELSLNFWKEGTGDGIEALRAFFEAKKITGKMTIGNPMRAAEVFTALVLGIVSMRSVVGLPAVAESREEQLAWAEDLVGLFMTLLEQSAL